MSERSPRWGQSNLQIDGVAFVCGAVGALALAPFDLWFVVFPAFAALIAIVAMSGAPRLAARRAWMGGLGWFGVSLHWIVQPFFVDAVATGWMAPFALVLMAGGAALFWAVPGWLAVRTCSSNGARAVAFAMMLFFAEAARGRVFSGLPWAQPGHGLIGSNALWTSAWIGPLGLSFLVLGVGGLAALLWLSRRPVWAVFPIGLGLALGAWPMSPTLAPPSETVARLVQINAPQHQKWDPEWIPVFYARALSLTAQAPGPLGAPDLVIWPETSLPEILRNSDVVRADISAAAGPATVIVGAQRYAGLQPRNVLAVLGAGGEVTAVYDKHHLVPFGEYLPLRNLAEALGLRGIAARLQGGYWPGDGPETLDLDDLGRVFPMICYETIFPRYLRQVERPDWQVVLTNDAWFGSFAMPYQHLALAQLRAAESGVPVLRVANTGVTAVIDAQGRILDALPMDQSGVIDTAVPSALPPTAFARFGHLPVFILALCVLVVTIVRTRVRERH